MHKVFESMKSFESQPLTRTLHFDEFIAIDKETRHVGRGYGRKKKKMVWAVELIDLGKVKRFYALKIKDFSAQSWIKTAYFWVSKKHIERFMNEYSYRINKSRSKEIIFHNLIKRMVSPDKLVISAII